ncbi:MinD/ParA family ATP-binding protein [Paraherbaspirillum soli]|uniref:MinD/ParA family protein n=1 Tax=Paraherbaspirillum soli TaxID=631222 RepID=A0ABW0MEN3_9BURK
MSKVVSDQADGLRRLMAQHAGANPVRVFALVGSTPAVGATSVALNLAAALAQQGQDVLLLEEKSGPQSASAVWQINTGGSWSDVAAQRLPLQAAAGRAACGVWVLPAAGSADQTDVRSVFQGQIVLIDASLDRNGALSPLAAQADEVIVVLRPQAASITAGYACIKQLHYAHALQQLRIMLNLATDANEAQRVLNNLVGTGSRYLALALEPAGCVVDDPRLAHAQRLGLSVVEAFQTSPAAIDFRRIAADLLQWPWRARVPNKQASPVGVSQPQRVLQPS